MARKKRSNLPSVTDADRLYFPEQVRTTPNGGWAWKCHYCGRYACDRSVVGRYLCRCHGGSTPRQRCPYQEYLHRLNTGEELRMPGRPIKLGRYARRPGISIAKLIEEGRAREEKHRDYSHKIVVKAIRDTAWYVHKYGKRDS